MKTPEELKTYLNRNKRSGEQVMLNIALKDLLDANTGFMRHNNFTSNVIMGQVKRIISIMINEETSNGK